MAGDIYWKEQSVVTVTSAGASAANLTATSAGTVDFRSGGTSNLAENLRAFAELTVQWSTTTGITQGVIVGELYLVPAIDGTNYADVDTTSGSSYIANNHRVGLFVSHKSLTGSTNYRFATAPFDVFPTIYTAYVYNRSGQTTTANWTLKLAAARMQYT